MKTKLHFVLQHRLYFIARSLAVAWSFLFDGPVKTIHNITHFMTNKNNNLNNIVILILSLVIQTVKAVDAPPHFLYEYTNGQEGHTASLDHAIIKKGRAILTSSGILCIGFGVMMFSKFIPIVNFGVLSAVIMLTALIGDLVILPAVIYLGPGSKK